MDLVMCPMKDGEKASTSFAGDYFTLLYFTL